MMESVCVFASCGQTVQLIGLWGQLAGHILVYKVAHFFVSVGVQLGSIFDPPKAMDMW